MYMYMHFMGINNVIYVRSCSAWQAKLYTKQNTHKLRMNQVTLVHYVFMTSFHHMFLCLIAMAITAMNTNISHQYAKFSLHF